MQKLPVPSDYGRAAVFLASDDAGMITGTDLRVDAGASARYWAWDPAAGASVQRGPPSSSRLALFLRELLAQGHLVDLAGGGHRQGIDEHHIVR